MTRASKALCACLIMDNRRWETIFIKIYTTVVPVVVIGAVDVVGTERVVAVNEENTITYTSKAHA